MRDGSSRTPDEARREFLRHTLVALGSLCWAPGWVCAAQRTPDRWLELRNIHTDEVLRTSFQDATGFVADGLRKLQHLLRDYRTGQEHEMDPELYVQLSDLARAAGAEPRYEVISGYRSPATNNRLHDTGHNVSEHSLHMQGKAMDVRLRGYDLAALRDLALAARRGGVGYYPHSNFIHIDTGRVRKWEGK